MLVKKEDGGNQGLGLRRDHLTALNNALSEPRDKVGGRRSLLSKNSRATAIRRRVAHAGLEVTYE